MTDVNVNIINEQISSFLQDVEAKILHINIEKRKVILEKISEKIKEEQLHTGLSLLDILNDKLRMEGIVNQILSVENEAPVHFKKKWGCMRYFLIFSIVFILVLGVKIYQFINTIKSHVRIEKIDPMSDMMKDFDDFDKIHDQMMKDLADMQSARLNGQTGTASHALVNGSFNIDQQKEIEFEFDKGTIEIINSDSSLFTYDCNSGDLTDLPITRGVETIKIKFDGRVSCRFSIPKDLKLNIKINTGAISLKNISQSFNLHAKDLVLDWKQPNFRDFNLNAKLSKVKIKGDLNVFENSTKKYNVDLEIEKGQLTL